MEKFDSARKRLEAQYFDIAYDAGSGLCKEELKAEFEKHCRQNPSEPRINTRAYLFNLICTRARIAPDRENYFADKVDHGNLFNELRQKWHRQEWRREFGDATEPSPGSFGYMVDLSHTCPDWRNVLKLGFTGLRDRAAKGSEVFHAAVKLAYDGAITLCRRLGEASDNEALVALSQRPPRTLHEAFQLAYLFHELQEMEGEPVRTMGWFDRLYIDFYREDIKAGRLTREEAKELIKYFWIGFYAKTQGKLFGKNFCFGPAINELSYLGMEVYYEMHTVDPKLSVLVDGNTPVAFIESAAKNIRDGKTGIVMLNYDIAVRALEKHGRAPEDAADLIPIGCYEPAVLGREISCSGATYLSLVKTMELVMNRESDYACFEEFKTAYFKRLGREAGLMMEQQKRCEKIWPAVNPAPFLSGTMDECMIRGMDISEGGAKYNTTGCIVSYLANAADSLAAVKELVYDEKICTLRHLKAALKADWRGHERLQMFARNRVSKWGNNDDRVDRLAVEIAQFIAPVINNRPNGRGGKFMAALFGQHVVERGRHTGALPDGRNAGNPVSKNLCAAVAMDKNGVTALMNSVLKINYTLFPNGACLDLMLHPSAVGGSEGVKGITSVIRAFIAAGGTGLQFNIFNVNDLREALREPDKYSNLQVRVCGWNARFVELSSEEQETFIAQAEAIS